jgi:hypothetical protein
MRPEGTLSGKAAGQHTMVCCAARLHVVALPPSVKCDWCSGAWQRPEVLSLACCHDVTSIGS